MKYATERKIVIITRQTRAGELAKKFNNLTQAAYYVEAMGGDIGEYMDESNAYKGAVAASRSRLQGLARVQLIDREHVPNFIFGGDDIVIVIGQDGLVANTMKYLDGQPLVAVNPDPTRYDGVLLPFGIEDVLHIVRDVIGGRRRRKDVTMAAAELNDGQSLLAVNDFFIGRQTHVSARYIIKADGKEERQSSSGIIVSTGLGSSGWLKSVVAGAKGIAEIIAGCEMPGEAIAPSPGWGGDYLLYSVREPFPSKTTGTSLIFGTVKETPIRIVSQMPEGGVIFSDGVEQDYLQFNSGIEATISVAAKKGSLVV
ncbi:MAG: sugar kinase [Oscillospiraceae bacterium]|nr:sugar kinase [Oscillospiraceae bacterium]